MDDDDLRYGHPPVWFDSGTPGVDDKIEKSHELLAQITELWLDDMNEIDSLTLDFVATPGEEPPMTLVSWPKNVLFKKLIADGLSICDAAKQSGVRHGCESHRYFEDVEVS